jgi:hypothetical protein
MSRHYFDATPQRLTPPAPPKGAPTALPTRTPEPDVEALDDYRCPNGCGSHACRGRCAPDVDRPPRWERW